MHIDIPKHRYNGARSMIVLHDQHLRQFLETWRQARKASLPLPRTKDPDYQSLEALLFHVMRAARGYMVWTCEVLGLPDPQIDATPGIDTITSAAATYVDHLGSRWATPLVDVPEERFEDLEYASRWNTRYCIDAMLEHAVMHPIRHEHQLRVLLDGARANR